MNVFLIVIWVLKNLLWFFYNFICLTYNLRFTLILFIYAWTQKRVSTAVLKAWIMIRLIRINLTILLAKCNTHFQKIKDSPNIKSIYSFIQDIFLQYVLWNTNYKNYESYIFWIWTKTWFRKEKFCYTIT